MASTGAVLSPASAANGVLGQQPRCCTSLFKNGVALGRASNGAFTASILPPKQPRRSAHFDLTVVSRSSSVSSAPLQSRGRTISLPVDHAQLLGLRGREAWSDSQIVSAYEELMGTPIEEGYTRGVAAARAVLLREARSQLLATKGRMPIRGRQLSVSWDAMPAALCLLAEVKNSWASVDVETYPPNTSPEDELSHEHLVGGGSCLSAGMPRVLGVLAKVGEYEAVLGVGLQVAEMREGRRQRQDVLLSMALSHCGLARLALERSSPALASARLEEAAGLLASPGTPPLAPHLQQEVATALSSLRPACILDQLQLPLEEQYAAVRRLATANLRSLLLDASYDGPPLDEGFVRTALQRLSAAEAATLLDWPSLCRPHASLAWATAGVLQRGALAQLAAGFASRQPSLIRAALDLLQQLPMDGETLPLLVVSHVLLGAPQDAASLLHQPCDTADAQQMQAEVLAFVKESPSETDADLLPGLVEFTSTWLAEVAFPTFRDTADSPQDASLVAYFEDVQVTGWLASYGKEGASPLAVVSAWGRDLQSRLRTLVPVDQGLGGQLPAVRLPAFSSWSRFEQGTAALSLAAIAFVGLSMALRPRPSPLTTTSTFQGPAVQAADGSAAGRARHWWGGQRATSTISSRTADRTIRTWQEAKAAALGPRHSKTLLWEALADPMLATVSQQVDTAAANGWFWTYTLNSVKVESVLPGPPPEDGVSCTATVTAKLEESSELWGVNGMKADSYASTYRVEYRMVQRPNGSWRIYKALLLAA